MQSFLITGENRQKLLEEVERIQKERKISSFDVYFAKDEEGKVFGIETFRRLKEKIFLKPFQSPEKIVVLDMTEGATPQAQNSMLKLLEEPPKSTLMIILGQRVDSFLPTIISRCQVIETENEKSVTDGTEIERILKAPIGERLVAAQGISKDKKEAAEFTKESILFLREQMNNQAKEGSPDAKKTAKTIKEFEKAYYALTQTNINARMTLENLFLTIS